MTLDFTSGVAVTLLAGVLFGLGFFLGDTSRTTDVRRQCEVQQSIRLPMRDSTEVFFWCGLEPRK